jgi:hypothetical protein
MVSVHNDGDHCDLAVLPSHAEFYMTSNVETNVPSVFKSLRAKDMSEIIDSINYHDKVRMAKYTFSGNHDCFANFIWDRPYLFLHWELQ